MKGASGFLAGARGFRNLVKKQKKKGGGFPRRPLRRLCYPIGKDQKLMLAPAIKIVASLVTTGVKSSSSEIMSISA